MIRSTAVLLIFAIASLAAVAEDVPTDIGMPTCIRISFAIGRG